MIVKTGSTRARLSPPPIIMVLPPFFLSRTNGLSELSVSSTAPTLFYEFYRQARFGHSTLPVRPALTLALDPFRGWLFPRRSVHTSYLSGTRMERTSAGRDPSKGAVSVVQRPTLHYIGPSPNVSWPSIDLLHKPLRTSSTLAERGRGA
ncbi:hypothetical protein D9611_010089 [Ephemerocybe angulata]|uniref:Uncharacterized protein n=1 Tax=Ephemerocybe angulata TaxID=980116 RepID=A0A8H5AZR8_9AGAR|nr:hypothetical protein D9611_010089 [Tulosesus angulatus]